MKCARHTKLSLYTHFFGKSVRIETFECAWHTSQFTVYVESMEQLVQWIFALDHINYARWIPVHVQDMQSLPESISEKFQSC